MDSDLFPVLFPVLFPAVNPFERARLFAHVDRIVEKWSDTLEHLPETDECEDDVGGDV